MAYYLKFPANNGTTAANNALVQLSGIAAGAVTISYVMAEDAPPFTTQRYIYDGRRSLDSDVSSGSTSYIWHSNVGLVQAPGVSGFLINGVTATALDLSENALADDICQFTLSAGSIVGGVLALGARYTRASSFYDWAIKSITINDTAGSHTIDMSDSLGSLNEFTSTDGLITLKLFSFPSGNTHWVFYESGSTSYTLTADSVTDSHTAGNVALTYSAGATAYSITCDAVSDSHIANDIELHRGYNLTSGTVADSHSASDITLIYSAGVTAYSITCEAVSDNHTANEVSFYRGYIMAIDTVTDVNLVGDVDFRRGYNLACDAVTDIHQAGEVTITYTTPAGTAYSITCESVADTHQAGAIAFNRGYVMQAGTVTDSHLAPPVNLIYSGEEIALITAYSVNYKQFDVSAAYKPTLIEVTYGDR